MHCIYVLYTINYEIVIHIWYNEIIIPLLFVLLSIHIICMICIIIYSYFHYSMWNLEKPTESKCKDLLEDLKDKLNLILTLNYILITKFK